MWFCLPLSSQNRLPLHPDTKDCATSSQDCKAVGSGEAGEALASPDFRPNSNISALTFFNFRVINM